MNNNKKTSLMLEYGDWLFENPSIIYERKVLLNEDLKTKLLDYSQFALAAIGAVTPLEVTGVAEAADILNTSIYLARGQYVNALLSGISVVPMIGDLFGKTGMFIKWLDEVIKGGTQTVSFSKGLGPNMLKAGEWLVENGPKLKDALLPMAKWIKTNKNRIHVALLAMHQAAKSRDENKNQSVASANNQSEGLDEDEETTTTEENDEFVSQFVNIMVSNERIREFLKETSVINGLRDAVQNLIDLLDETIALIDNLSKNNETETVSETEPKSLTESYRYTDMRFKKLAGIIE